MCQLNVVKLIIFGIGCDQKFDQNKNIYGFSDAIARVYCWQFSHLTKYMIQQHILWWTWNNWCHIGVPRESIILPYIITRNMADIAPIYHCYKKKPKQKCHFDKYFHHWLLWKLPKCQLPVQPVMKILSKCHFHFSNKCEFTEHDMRGVTLIFPVNPSPHHSLLHVAWQIQPQWIIATARSLHTCNIRSCLTQPSRHQAS